VLLVAALLERYDALNPFIDQVEDGGQHALLVAFSFLPAVTKVAMLQAEIVR
jgi:hypothetical protein